VARTHTGWNRAARAGGHPLPQRLVKVDSAAVQLALLERHFLDPLERAA
jgi:hypothetical protein